MTALMRLRSVISRTTTQAAAALSLHKCINACKSELTWQSLPVPLPRCTGHWTPPPGLWGSSSQRLSGNEPPHSWWTDWCVPHSSPHQWCAPAACFPPPGGTPGSHRRHGSRWLQAPKMLFLRMKQEHRLVWVSHSINLAFLLLKLDVALHL